MNNANSWLDECMNAAEALVRQVTPSERERMLLQGWLAHDARWFNAVAQAYGLPAANEMNQQAAHEAGRAEARRTLKQLGLPPPADVDACVVAQQAMGRLLAPGLVDYTLSKDAGGVRFEISRCFAFENVTRAGISADYRCGIFPRLQGWWDVFDVGYELTPSPGACMLAASKPCAYTIAVNERPPGS
jgi:hypothetical protein